VFWYFGDDIMSDFTKLKTKNAFNALVWCAIKFVLKISFFISSVTFNKSFKVILASGPDGLIIFNTPYLHGAVGLCVPFSCNIFL